MTAMTKADRDSLIRLVKARARQAEREADMREKVLLAEVRDQLTAEFEAHDRLWADAVIVAEEAAARANAQIRAQSVELGIPARHAPQLELGWHARSPEYADRNRRAELHKLAETRLAALTKTAKTAIQAAALETETQLVLGGLESSEARQFLAAMPTVEQLMPPLCLDDLGVTRWQPPEDAAAQLTTPMSATDRRRRQIRRAIEANPDASDRRIAEIAGCDHKTIASYRRGGEFGEIGGEFPALTAELPTEAGDDE